MRQKKTMLCMVVLIVFSIGTGMAFGFNSGDPEIIWNLDTLKHVPPPNPIQTDQIGFGKKVYDKHCASCHGLAGQGDGPLANTLDPRPTSFVQGTFKIRSTFSGELPLDSDLTQTVKFGMPGTSMIAWDKYLSGEEIFAVVQYVKSLVLDRGFDDTEFEEVTLFSIGENPWKTQSPLHEGIPKEAIKRGRELYVINRCVECHGDKGNQSKSEMKNDWGYPIRAANLQECQKFKGTRGDLYNPSHIARTFITGMNGTPMPSYAGRMTLPEIWKLSAYILSLCSQRSKAFLGGAAKGVTNSESHSEKASSAANVELLDALLGDEIPDFVKAKQALNSGADINSILLGRTYLLTMVRKGKVEGVKFVLKNGAYVNGRSRFGRTPLHEAALYGFLGIAKVLLNAGADVNATNPRGETPLFYATNGLPFGPKHNKKHDQVVELLQDLGGVLTKKN